MFRQKICTALTFVILGWGTTVEPGDNDEKSPDAAPTDYARLRGEIVENELQARGASRLGLTDAERRVEAYLDRWRNQELAKVRELQSNRRLIAHNRFFRSGALYKHFQQMPKGAVLHAHAGAIQDLHWLVETAVGRRDCYIYLPRPGEQSEEEGCFRLASEPPADARWQLVADLRAQSGDCGQFDQRLYESLTLGAEDENVEDLWNEFERCWRRICSLADHPLIYRDFYRRELETVAAANVQLLELRTFLDFPVRKSRPVSPSEALIGLEALHKELSQKHPAFRLRVIYSRDRSDSVQQIEKYLAEAVQLRKEFPHLVSGFDLVGQEEGGRTLYDLVPLFIQAKGRAERAGTTLPLFLHAGETFHRGFGNILDAVLLDATRIGHGLSLTDHPALRARIKAESIPIEICPFSSYVLRNISDISQHPARAWFRDAMCISINPDDPGLMGCDLALDWYLVFVTWQLSLAELKKLVQNGIHASSLPDDERRTMMHEWERRWELWIAGIDREAQTPQPRAANPR
jgi:adenosine deaminase CECR1